MLFLFACDGATESNTDNNSIALKDGCLRINFTGSKTPMGAWIWGDFDKSEIAKCTTWGDKAFPLTGKRESFVSPCSTFSYSLALPFFGIGMKTDLFWSWGHC